MRKTTLVCSILLYLGIVQVLAQSHPIGSPNITNFTRTTYKAGTQNWMIEQDQRGIIYFANNKGLLEFDGTYWSNLPLPNGTVVRSIAVHENGKIYIGGQDEFGYVEADENGKHIYHSLSDLVPEDLASFEDVWRVFIKEEAVYFCSYTAIFQVNGNEELQVVKPRQSRFENFFKIKDKVYVQEIDGGLYEVKGEQLSPFITSDLFKDEGIVAMLPHDNGKVLVFTFSNGLFLLDNQGVIPWESPANDFLKSNQAFCAIELRNGKYAVGTPQNGVLIMSREGEPELHLNERIGLQNNTVLSLAQDFQGNLWLGLDNGIDYAEINSPFSIIRSEQGITGTGYASVIHEDKLYLGTNQGLFYTDWNEKESPIFVAKFKPVENGLGQVWNINKVEDEIIIGQHKGASFLRSNSLDRFFNEGAWKFLPLKAHPGYAIEGTYSGLYLYQRNKNNTWELVHRIAGFEESARVFEEDKNGAIWVSHAYKGLYKLTFSNDLKQFDNVELFGVGHGLPDSLLINVSKVRNELIFSTKAGVFKYDKPNNQFIAHQDFLEIFGEGRNFHRVIQDELGNIWFSVDNEFGVIVVEEQGVFNKFKIFYFNQVQDDLVDGFEHIYAHDKNNIIIGAEKGFLHYSPLADKATNFPFDILIRKVTSITQSDSVIYWGNGADQLNADYTFNYKMNDFRFTFSVPYYEKIGYLAYRFKLEGFDENWTSWTPKTEKEYTNLRSGDYVFKVQAKNAYGELSNEASFKITIQPPWYWSIFAKIFYVIIGMLALFSLTKYISKRERKKTEAFKKEQTEKLVQKEEEFKKEVEKSESEIIKLKNEKLQDDIKNKTGQLASATMHLVQKSEILMKIKNDLKGIESEATKDVKKKIQQITRTIESDIQLDDNWEQFENYFDQVHENFFKRLRIKYPELTPKDQKLCAYLRMNLTTKEIAPLMNISVRGVEISRYRLRKKLGLDSEVNLVAFILEL